MHKKVTKATLASVRRRIAAEGDGIGYAHLVAGTRLLDWKGGLLLEAGEIVEVSEDSAKAVANAGYWLAYRRLGDNCRARVKEYQRDAEAAAKRQREQQESFKRSMDDIKAMVAGLLGGTDADLKTLGLSAMPDMATLKAAYRTQAMKHHPDRGGSQEQFIAVSAAYERIAGRL